MALQSFYSSYGFAYLWLERRFNFNTASWTQQHMCWVQCGSGMLCWNLFARLQCSRTPGIWWGVSWTVRSGLVVWTRGSSNSNSSSSSNGSNGNSSSCNSSSCNNNRCKRRCRCSSRCSGRQNSSSCNSSSCKHNGINSNGLSTFSKASSPCSSLWYNSPWCSQCKPCNRTRAELHSRWGFGHVGAELFDLMSICF